MSYKKRVLIISDLHCGHIAGLTPPSYLHRPAKSASKKFKEEHRLRREAFDWYYRKIKSLMPINTLIVNGDLIDGRGERSGGVELIATDRFQQCDMAKELINIVNATKTIITYGTPYHTGQLEDFEDEIAKDVGAQITGHAWVDINGIKFDCKHKVGSSGVPHGRHTSVAKEKLWNTLWSEHDGAPKSDIFIRSHVHYHNYCGGKNWLAMTTPALQGPGSKYGIRQCSGTIDFGFLHFDVKPSGNYEYKLHTKNLINKEDLIING